MARNLEELIAYGEELAERFEDDSDRSRFREPSTRSKVALAAMRRSYAERDLRRAVVAAKREGLSWDQLGAILGVSGEAARKRYSKAVVEEQVAPPALNVNSVKSHEAAPRPPAAGPAEALSALFPRLDVDDLGRVREVLLSLHHEAQGAEAERFEESLNRLLRSEDVAGA